MCVFSLSPLCVCVFGTHLYIYVHSCVHTQVHIYFQGYLVDLSSLFSPFLLILVPVSFFNNLLFLLNLLKQLTKVIMYWLLIHLNQFPLLFWRDCKLAILQLISSKLLRILMIPNVFFSIFSLHVSIEIYFVLLNFLFRKELSFFGLSMSSFFHKLILYGFFV